MDKLGIFGFVFCNNTRELKYGCNFAGEAHSLKVEKILFQGKSEYQNVMVFQVHEVPVNCEVTVTNFSFSCSYLYCQCSAVMSSAVINIWQGSCFGWSNSANRKGWMCLPRNDHSSSSLLYSKPQKGFTFAICLDCMLYVWIVCLVFKFIYFFSL